MKINVVGTSGVGKSTVSRVLNQDPNVNPQTRDRVEAVIREALRSMLGTL